MKIKLVTLSTELDHPGWLKFKKSLDHFGYDYHIIYQQVPSGAHVFGTQMPLVYEYLKWLHDNTDYTHVIYCDAWDTMALGNMQEFKNKLVYWKIFGYDPEFIGSAEKACFPNPNLSVKYPPCDTDWKYVNGGGWFASIKFFLQMYDQESAVGVNDQLWLAQRFLDANDAGCAVWLDHDCELFQTIGFEAEDDFGYAQGNPGRLVNFKTNQLPIFIHGNGRTDMSKIWNLFKTIFLLFCLSLGSCRKQYTCDDGNVYYKGTKEFEQIKKYGMVFKATNEATHCY